MTAVWMIFGKKFIPEIFLEETKSHDKLNKEMSSKRGTISLYARLYRGKNQIIQLLVKKKESTII